MKLDDKSERITLGLVDIARQGNAFTIWDADGSLPYNMTVKGWRKKFELGQVQSSQQKQQQRSRAETAKAKKNKRVILEDSGESGDEGNTSSAYKKTPSAQESNKRSLKRPREENNDGLAVRVRQATDVSNNNENNKRPHLSTKSTIDELYTTDDYDDDGEGGKNKLRGAFSSVKGSAKKLGTRGKSALGGLKGTSRKWQSTLFI